MLQWMGGSRRKVSTSRKSTQTRQKQYFEQRKRQKLSAGPEYHEDRRQKCLNHHDELNSLDILSLNNLAATAKECIPPDINENNALQEETKVPHSLSKFSLNNIISYGDHLRKPCKDLPLYFSEEDLGGGVSLEAVHRFEDSPEFASHQGVLPARDHLMETNNSACSAQGNLNPEFSAETVEGSPRKADDDVEECKASGMAPLSDRRQMGTASRKDGTSENHISLLDLVDDDQSYCQSEGLPSEEHHVAFSVEGLGKISMKTPVHSPRQLESFQSPTSDSKWMSYSLKISHDVVPNLGTMDNDSSSDDGSPSEFLGDTWHMKDTLFNSNSLYCTKRSTTSGSDSYDVQDPFLMGKEMFTDQRKQKATRVGRMDLLGEFHLDDVDYGTGEERPFSLYFNTPAHKAKRHSTYQSGFEDIFSQDRRFEEEDKKKFSISGGARSSLWPPSAIEDQDFLCSDPARYRELSRSSCPKRSKAPAQSISIAEGATDSISLLSEESCSTATEGGNKRTGCMPPGVGKSEKSEGNGAKLKKDW